MLRLTGMGKETPEITGVETHVDKNGSGTSVLYGGADNHYIGRIRFDHPSDIRNFAASLIDIADSITGTISEKI